MTMAARTVTLGATGIVTTPLGFGCANLFALPSTTARLALLDAAYDAGVRHFDVAPMYGLGRAEGQLSGFLRRHRGDVVVSTKFGIRATTLARGLGGAQRPVRQAFNAMPALRGYARASAAGPRSGALGPLLYAAEGYGAAAARSSLQRSLRALGVDYVDLFLLHDPAPGSVPSAEVASYLDQARQAGLIRSWGIAGEPEPVVEVARAFSGGVPVVQLRDDILARQANGGPSGKTGSAAVITFGVLRNALRQIVGYLSSDEARRRRWDQLIGADCARPDVAASLLLRAARQGNESGVVLFCTSRPARIASAVAATQQRAPGAEDPALDAFMALVASELKGPGYREESGS
jgi:D-threo-aldose 1-dehydrogenase